ncbi:MAG: DUF4422 domain-containing protein [Formosimonas sp.]
MNTLNICLGHRPFPQSIKNPIDLMLAPKIVDTDGHLAIIPDSTFGASGSALSEYAQLLWLYKNIDTIAQHKEYLHIFQYRRFCATHATVGQATENNPWSFAIQEADLIHFENEFYKHKNQELFNTVVQFEANMVNCYAGVHVLEDMEHFGRFLAEQCILSPEEVQDFFSSFILIPACNIGVFKIPTFKAIFSILEKAAQFLHSEYFIQREGYQRRSVGFLLERLNSYLILAFVKQGILPHSFGHNLIISETNFVASTQLI